MAASIVFDTRLGRVLCEHAQQMHEIKSDPLSSGAFFPTMKFALAI